MRFSAVFQFPLPLPRAAQVDPVRAEAAPLIPVGTAVAEPSRWPLDLPDDLDARVRLVGEWQLGEG